MTHSRSFFSTIKYFLICSILCFSGVQRAWSQIDYPRLPSPELKRVFIEECAQEFKMPVFKNGAIYTAFQFIAYYYPGPKTDKMVCMVTCIARKQSEFEGLTLYKKILRDIDFLYMIGLGSKKVTREELKSKVEYCQVKESNECEFYKCLDVMKPPFLDLSVPSLKIMGMSKILSKFN